MAEFQELIKNFERIREYMRQFYIYGFKVRRDFDGKSARTYDNERRRIESWLADYTKSDYTAKGKHVYINVDSKEISQNPLYAAWKSKSFTDNDLLLHFFILDQLWEHEDGLNAGELCDHISEDYGVVFDSQTVRLKLKEYEALQLLRSRKDGRNLIYQLEDYLKAESCGAAQETNGAAQETNGTAQGANGAAQGADDPAQDPDATDQSGRPSPQTWQHLITAVSFFQGASPFGFIGSTILDREQVSNDWFQFKHHFIVHTLEDGALADVLSAMKEGRSISFTNRSGRSGCISQHSGLPMKIFVSTQTGRRYVCMYMAESRRFNNFRLDSMTDVKLLELRSDRPRKLELLEKNLSRLWGVSFSGTARLEEIYLRLHIDEEKERHIINRLYREGRGGEIQKIRDNEYLYSGAFFDTNEMLSWIKTFTGRILDIQGSNAFAIAKITHDWESMYKMYCQDDSQEKEET